MLTSAQRWKDKREAAGYSVMDAASYAGVHRNTIYDLEKGDEGVTLRMMNRVAAAYGITLDAIFCEPSAENVPSELRPLHELLTPLDVEARIAFVRNVVSNAKFMAHLVTVRDTDHNETSANPVNTSAIKSSRTDSEGAESAAVGTGSVKEPSRVVQSTAKQTQTAEIKKAGKRR